MRTASTGSEDTRPAQALSGFTRFPVWMWRNIHRLRSYNDSPPLHAPQVGFYGLDLYSMNPVTHRGDSLPGKRVALVIATPVSSTWRG